MLDSLDSLRQRESHTVRNLADWEMIVSAEFPPVDPSGALLVRRPHSSDPYRPAGPIVPGLSYFDSEHLDRRRPAGWTFYQRVSFLAAKYLRPARVINSHGAKRAVDVLISASLLLSLFPVFALIAVLIKATDGGAVLFWQVRIGRYGQRFWCPKFRSMVPDAETRLTTLLADNQHKSGVTFKLKHDPRLTRVGRVIRRASLDELPQLWSVLVGDMSLVGPRPAIPREVSRYTLAERRRLDVRPGLTCTWQVSGRGDIPFERQVEMDLDYIDRRTMLGDLKLLISTIPAVLSGRGAY